MKEKPSFIKGFIYGLYLVLLIMPLIDFVVSMLNVLNEAIVSKIAVFISKNNAETQKYMLPEESSHAIGFDINSATDEFYDDDEEYEEDECKHQHRIGF